MHLSIPTLVLGALACSAALPAQTAFFENKQAVSLGTGDAWCPTMNQDETEIVFSSTRTGGAGGYDLWTATRANPDAAWGVPTNLVQLNSTASDYEPTISPDGLELYFISTRTGGPGTSNVMLSTRPSIAAPWGPPTFLGAPVNGTGLANDDPALTDDGLTMFFSENGDIHTVTRTSTTGQWGNKTAFAPANVKGANEHSPTPYSNGNMLVFGSTATGGTGSSDFYFVYLDTTTNVWSTPVELKELNLTTWDSNAYWGRRTGRIYWSDWSASAGPVIQCMCYKLTIFSVFRCVTVRLVPYRRPYWPAPVMWCKRWIWRRSTTVVVRFYDWRPNTLWVWGISPLPNPTTGITIPGIMVGGLELNPVNQLLYLPGGQPLDLPLPIPNTTPLGVVNMQAFGVDTVGNKIYTSDMMEADIQ
ncbi:MAG: PD40 domain-containing protein [Planctomycetes bacterium]|nr:PD40 domain-containing protein [Planctomycetota bacterium]MCB9871107.1 PD40 domain-containing protein [Planctomycetota bacterium]MCB9888255.1 PD40 domain-containing protein [Planctomycetota bacterium]